MQKCGIFCESSVISLKKHMVRMHKRVKPGHEMTLIHIFVTDFDSRFSKTQRKAYFLEDLNVTF